MPQHPFKEPLIDENREHSGACRTEHDGSITVIADRYEEDWSRLAWVMLHGRAEILEAGEEHDEAQSLLRRRYPQLQRMQIDGLPVIALRIARSTSWGKLAPDVAS